jgi:NADH dehydrogenase FAD-containing subunit
VATGKRPDQRPLVEMLQGTAVHFQQGWVTALQPKERTITLQNESGQQTSNYDFLVYAPGSQVDRDSVPGVRQWAYTLDGQGQKTAEPLHEQLQTLAAVGGRVVVVGSGPTGIEIAGEIRDAFPNLTVKIVTGGKFGAFTAERVRDYMAQALGRLNIEISENALVKEVKETEIHFGRGQQTAYDLLVWAGGFKAPALASKAGLKVNERNQMLVNVYLQSLSHPDIFAIGDAGFPVTDSGAPYRMSLFTSLVTAAHTADNLLNLLNGKALRPFGFSTYGQGIALGRNDAIGFNSYPHDRPVGPLVTGRMGLAVRNFFVWLILRLLTVERKLPGFFFWPGRNSYGREEIQGIEQYS